MDNDEIINALIKGAIVRIPASGDARVEAMDDVSPAIRECIRASMTHDWKHQRQCPNCLENDADHLLMEAASHREDGNLEDAQALELEAAVLCRRAEKIRHGK